MKKMCLVVCMLFIAVVALVGCNSDSAYPSKDIKTIVPYGAGGTTDLTVRALFDAVPKEDMPNNSSFLVSNVTGGSGLVGANEFTNSDSDGYTLGVLNCDLLLNEVLGNTEITVDDYVPLVAIQDDPYAVVVSAEAPFQTFEELIDYAKEHPGEITIGDSGSGSANNLAVRAMEKFLGVSFNKVSYDSSADSVISVVSGEIDATVTHTSAATGQLDAEKVKILAVTSNERLSTYPDVPAIGELYEEASDMKVDSWIFLAARPNTEQSSIEFLQDTFSEAVNSDKFKTSIKNFHMQEVSMTSEEMKEFIKSQREYYKKVLN
ncbi:tripartite tricarboxylate transporter substrate binding protein [Radiobacillus sp. PE A8.2]|uniref:tripartite tricarboxylate transporter substrate binding protein n=1 Tax=Radiobacillus sp. PE A8.2 TaxID=3380349 RepID=UPI00388F8C9F